MHKQAATIAFLTVLACGVAAAAELEDGQKELALSATWSDTDNTGSRIDADVLLGFLLSAHHEIGPVVTYQSFDPDEQDLPEELDDAVQDLLDNDLGVAGGFYRYNFSTDGAIVPYFGAQAGLPFGDLHDVIDWTAGVEAGIRVMPSDTASLNIEAFYNRQFASSDFDDDFDQWGLAAGISIFFGGE